MREQEHMSSTDAQEYMDLVFRDAAASALADWNRAPTLHAAGAVAEHLSTLPSPTFCDYACGPGVASLVLADALPDPGAVTVRCVDLRNPWFVVDESLARRYREVTRHELNPEGRILTVDAVLGEGSVDALWVSMAIHLFPRSAWDRIFAGWAKVLRPGGIVVYSTPDIAPASADAELIHTLPRLCRRIFEDAHDAGVATVADFLQVVASVTGGAADAEGIGEAELAWLVDTARAAQVSDQTRRRAAQHIAPEPSHEGDIHRALSLYLEGRAVTEEVDVDPGVCHRMLDVPSNHENLFPDVQAGCRRRFAVSLCRLVESARPVTRLTWTRGVYRKPVAAGEGHGG